MAKEWESRWLKFSELILIEWQNLPFLAMMAHVGAKVYIA
jgi:hypothetical protein